jgi:hypothetical protein
VTAAARTRAALGALGLVVALSGCAGHLGPASPASGATTPSRSAQSPVVAPSNAADDLAGIQSDLDEAASAQAQSQADLGDGDAAARQGDDSN